MTRAVATDRLPTLLIEPPPRDEDSRRLLFRVDAASFSNGKDSRDECKRPSIAADYAGAKSRRSGRGVNAVHGVGAIIGSILLHSAAAAAAMLLVVAANQPWLLSQRQGKDSIALAASMAAPPPKSEETITVVPSETPPTPKSSEPKLPDAEPMEDLAKQALAVAERPSAAFADFKENPRLPPAPISETRAEIESPELSDSLPTDPPKRKQTPTEHALPRDSTASTTPASVASAASAADSGVVTDLLPAIVHAVPPTYPPESKAARETGVVKLRVKIDSLGQVVAASIHRSSGFTRLDQAALDAIHSYRFTPADGSSSGRAAEFVWPITFRLNEVPARR